MSSPARRMTYRALVRLPEDGLRHEILQGAWVMTPPPNSDHQRLVPWIAKLLLDVVAPRKLGAVLTEPGVYFSETVYVVPDVAFVSTARRDRLRKPYLRGAPDLVVEVLSPATREIDLGEKLRLYRKRGVREYWIVDAEERRIDVHDFAVPRRARMLEEGMGFESRSIPGLRVEVAEVFAVLDS